ncbi:unnamed protein product [Rodentolepis nana]|uniref:Uncharacterized protein n=1 Tax=Rodentolepis nana TaxID=102285 RepID=A0A0R3TER9_RODNA|nr:unnamed protein product [Rodentolepis nana]
MLWSVAMPSRGLLKCLPLRQFSISTINDHVPLIKFRAHQSIENGMCLNFPSLFAMCADPVSFSLENNPTEPSLHPNFFRKPISEEELNNFQVCFHSNLINVFQGGGLSN